MSTVTEPNLTEWRERAEFWPTRDPSTIGHLYDKDAVAFACEVVALLDRLAEAWDEGWTACVDVICDPYEIPDDKWRENPYRTERESK